MAPALALLPGAVLALWLSPNQLQMEAAWRQPESSPAAQLHPRREFLVVVDPGHGGDDPGAILPGKLVEKDLTLALAREIKQALEDRGVAVRLLRESDVKLSLEQRAELANEARPGLYLAVHAGSPGSGARVYAPSLPSPSASAMAPFIPWENAQAGSIEQSKVAAHAVTAEMRKAKVNVREMTVSLRPLNNVAAPAIAVEWATGPPTGRSQPAQKVEIALASAIAAGVVQARNLIGVRP